MYGEYRGPTGVALVIESNGDDIEAVSKSKSKEFGGKTIVPVRCEGFRGVSQSLGHHIANDAVRDYVFDKMDPNRPAPFESSPYDVAIIGAGVIGCALAYELSQYRLRVVLIDRAFDVGEGTSKGNSAIIHTGFDAEPGSLESQLVTAASRQWPALAERLKIPFMPVSALMLAFTEEQHAQLPALREKALANGVDDVELVTAEVARQLEPHISPAVRGGLVVPRESIVDPFTTSVAYAEVARKNGVDLALGWEVTGVGVYPRPLWMTTRTPLAAKTSTAVASAGSDRMSRARRKIRRLSDW